MYPTTRLVFDRKKVATKPSAKEPKQGLIQIEVSFQRKRRYVTTGVKVYQGQWHDERGVVNHQDSYALNERVNGILASLRKFVNQLIDEREPFTWDALDRWHNAHDNKQIGLIDWIYKTISERNDIKQNSKRVQFKIVSSLSEYGKIKAFGDLTIANIKDYDNWLHGKYTMQSTIHSYHKTLKTYVNIMMVQGLIKHNPYDSIKVDKGKTTSDKFLTDDEMQAIQTASLATDGLRHARDLFVIQMYTGLAYTDLTMVDWSKIVERDGHHVLVGQRIKSREDYYIVLLRPVLDILIKYNYRLPLVNLNKYNDRLKVVADAAGINKPISSHWARRSAGYWMLNNGAPIEVVSKVLGHASIKMTESIYAKILNKTIDKTFAMLADKV